MGKSKIKRMDFDAEDSADNNGDEEGEEEATEG